MASTSVDLERDGDEPALPASASGFCTALDSVVARGGSGLDERVQRDAIVRLRAGATANPGLLALLAERRFAEAPVLPPGGDPVQHALGVPDVVCLLAPPGVNRTLTVLAIVRAAAERGERVLITAPTAAALDTVVSRLPAGTMVVRTDQSGNGPGTLGAVAAGVQQRILARSQAAAHSLEAWLGDPSPAKGWLRRLGVTLEEAREARARADAAGAERDVLAAEVRERLAAPVRAAEQAVEAAEHAAGQAQESERRLSESWRRAEGRRFGRWWAGRLRTRLDQATSRAADARATLDRARREHAIRSALFAKSLDAEIRAVADRAAFAEVAAQRAMESAERTACQLSRMLDGVAPVPEWTADAPGLSGLSEHCHRWEPVLRARAGLIREWRQRAARPSRQLHPELLRYADVVATTCLGAGRPEHGDLEFDLVVVEDAGRVPVPVALVPLVRARRAVLAGEPSRSPRGDVSGSVLDLLAAGAPEANRVRLP